ncbi:MAG: 30S ribosomal protein S6 [Ruminococcaceae bacterium]|nr:30S ribosomal protein S6 [Oscillospiraceae bacterium]
MNSYETLFITDISNGEEAAKATVEKFTSLIGSNGEIVEVDTWGKRRLAYLINDMSEGFYTVVTYKAVPSFIAELERQFNIDETIMRSMTIRLDFEPVAKKVVVEETVEEVVAEVAEEVAEVEEAVVETVEATDAE